MEIKAVKTYENGFITKVQHLVEKKEWMPSIQI